MNFVIDWIKKRENKIIGSSNDAVANLKKRWNSFLKQDRYLTYSDKTQFKHYLGLVNKEVKIPWYFFWNFRLKIKIRDNLEFIESVDQHIPVYNSEFLIKKKKEYAFLFKKKDLVLDEDQQTAVIKDDDHNLVVAGAGSGKTEVLITRVAYLIKRKSDTIKGKRILVLAFQSKAAEEVKDRLKERYGIEVEVKTFHALGKKIIEDYSKIKHIDPPKLKNECSEEWKYRIYIQKLFDKSLISDLSLKNEVINYMKFYGDKELIKTQVDFSKKEEFYNYQRSLTYTTLDGTKVKSEAEREIMNFFIMHNLNGKKIKILYEQPAEWMRYTDKEGKTNTPKPDFYFPELDIYLEHWAVNKKGEVPAWFSGKDPPRKYHEHMSLKREKYPQNNKILIETSQADLEEGNFLEILENRFTAALQKKLGEGFTLLPAQYSDLVERVWTECKESIKLMPANISRFIVIAKTYRLYPQDIFARLNQEKWSQRQIAFTKIALIIYSQYQKELGNSHIDFADMINKATDFLKEEKKLYNNVYDHILIDEYQDISAQRYGLIRGLMEKNKNCKLFCVGDDWQSIMGFAGSNLNYFINFGKYFPHPERTDLTKNYRSIKSIVDAGAHIIKQNKDAQIKKKTISHSNLSKPFMVYSSLHQKEYFVRYYEQIAKHCINTIKEYHQTKSYSFEDFMILLRITNKPKLRNFMTTYAQKEGIPISDGAEKPNCVRLMSVHKSKGLQARVVIILNVDRDLYGFPCELENPDIFLPAIKENDGLRDYEERRLFYVAVTRAKEEVIMYTQKNSESKFITEIKDFVKREELSY